MAERKEPTLGPLLPDAGEDRPALPEASEDRAALPGAGQDHPALANILHQQAATKTYQGDYDAGSG